MENLKSLILKDVCKSFGEKKVLESINLSFESGKVYALLGENGSGKSTLAKIIAGEVTPESASFFLREKETLSELKIFSPKDAIQHKIGNVSQNPTICKDLYVWENVLLGDKKVLSPFFVNKAKLIEKVKNHIDDLGICLNLEKKGSECRASEKFFVCLARTLFLEKDILILDEPTASLSKEEKSVLFGIIDKFRQQEKTVILITHNKEDALSFADEIVFLQKEKEPLVGKAALDRLESFFFAGSGNKTDFPANSNSGDEFPEQVDSKDGLVFAVENLFAYEKTERISLRQDRQETLSKITEDTSADEESKALAYKSIIDLAAITEKEQAIENLVMSCGYDDCIIYFFDDGTIDVYVATTTMSGVEATKIADLVARNAGTSLDKVYVKSKF